MLDAIKKFKTLIESSRGTIRQLLLCIHIFQILVEFNMHSYRDSNVIKKGQGKEMVVSVKEE
jgi:hypothetical protein